VSDSAPLTITTPRLLLRCWEIADAPLLADAIEASVPELQQWTPWVVPETDELAELEERIAKFRELFFAGQTFAYGVFDLQQQRALGHVGLYGRVGPDALELGYWIRSDVAGRGYASEAARALTELAFSQCGVSRVEVHCDAGNAASVAIARRLGFTMKSINERNLMIWELCTKS